MVWRIFGKAVEKIRDGLSKTRSVFTSKIKGLFTLGRKIDAQFLEELEEAMITADMGVETTTEIVGMLKEAYRNKVIKESGEVLDYLKDALRRRLTEESNDIRMADTPPTVILVAGVNGSGKTTSIAKIAKHYVDEGKKVLLAASDTFRAAAVEQLSIWAGRIGCDIVRHSSGADPGAVTFDAAEAALARGMDMLIVDTAGRLHTQRNLMEELGKIRRVLEKKIPGAPHEVMLVLDATTGQNAISQAKVFKEAIQITGLFVAKLDGTAKGGVVLAIKNQLGIPVKFIGVGEKLDDIEQFDADAFVKALFE
jgi:fused signal recognition particle receptor